MRQTRRPLWVILGLAVLALLASIATGFLWWLGTVWPGHNRGHDPHDRGHLRDSWERLIASR